MNLEKIQQEYTTACATPSDINEHLPTLYAIAKECKSICEMGVRAVVSTWAFLMAQPEKYIGYDINQHKNMIKVMEAYPKAEMIIADVLKVEIEETDLLFVDTLHTFEQLSQELKLHADKARKYIILHDTVTYAHTPEPIDWQTDNIKENYTFTKGKGIVDALQLFLSANENWYIEKEYKNNNGLTILKRQNG